MHDSWVMAVPSLYPPPESVRVAPVSLNHHELLLRGLGFSQNLRIASLIGPCPRKVGSDIADVNIESFCDYGSIRYDKL